MLNQLVLVGRLVSDPIVKELEDGKEVCYITIATPRSFKNEEGEYDTDYIDITLWNMVARNVNEYCKKGDLVGIKGRIETRSEEKEDGTKNKIMEIIAEKVTFLSSNKEEK